LIFEHFAIRFRFCFVNGSNELHIGSVDAAYCYPTGALETRRLAENKPEI
jgi:hypothetical protein